MATILFKVSKGIDSVKRIQYIASGAHGATMSGGDIIDVIGSLGKPAKYLYIETTATCDLKIRLNSQVACVPMRDAGLNFPNRPATEDTAYITDDSMNAIPIGANEVYEMDNIIPITDIELETWTTGTFEILIA